MLSRLKKKSTTSRREGRKSPSLPRNEVFSYHTNRTATSGQSTDRKRVGVALKAPSFQWHQIPGLLALIAILISVGYIISLSSDPKIAPISGASSSLLRSQSTYHDGAKQILSSSLMNATKLTIDTAKFNSEMKKRFPELSDASITLPLMGRRPIVELTIVRPAIILSNGRDNYLIDSSGIAIQTVSDSKVLTSLNLPVVTDQSNLKTEVGKGALTSQSVTFITTFVAQLKAKQIQATSLTLPAIANQLIVKFEGANYYIKTSMIANPRISAGEFLAMKQKLDSDHTTPSEYIDVRLEEKVYYK